MTDGTHPLPGADPSAGQPSAGSGASASGASGSAASPLPVFLSTEHWSLLGTRSMTWSEIMSRIQIHLTVLSAFLVVLALTAQATGFGTPFRVLAIGFASAALVMGTLTAVRINTASLEDADLVRAMNRIRHAYVDLVPELAPYLTAGIHDDDAGLMHTYALGRRRNTVLHVVGSTGVFLMAVNTLVAGTLGALVADASGAGTALTVVVGVVTALLYALSQLEMGRRTFTTARDVRFPTDA
ncbi:hypothetical protein [Intrasporangium flavum]|uniref:hypothetical protein n=1 Tax=Intrasporangium flavum TaxID=1428657 RepID=UPI00096E208D|nr:hypothetical protein [Intrasporangium flavum]